MSGWAETRMVTMQNRPTGGAGVEDVGVLRTNKWTGIIWNSVNVYIMSYII